MRYSRAGVVTSPPSGPRSNDAGVRPHIAGHRETRKRTDTAVARREARTHPATDASQQVRSQPDKTRATGAPSRRAIPLDSGEAKREEDGRIPAPKQSNRGRFRMRSINVSSPPSDFSAKPLGEPM